MSSDNGISGGHGAELPNAVHNKQGGMYVNGQRYCTMKRLDVLKAYFKIFSDTSKVVVSKLSETANVSVGFASKFVKDFEAGKPVLDGKKAVRRSHPGISTLEKDDEVVLLELYEKEAQTTLHEYQEELLLKRSKLVSIATLHRYWQKRFPHKAKFKAASRVPIDKFKTENMIRSCEFKGRMSRLNMNRVKFGDESHKRGADCFSKRSRANPFTGEVPAIVMDPDFRTAFTIIGFCGIDANTFAFDFYIHRGRNCSDYFFDAIKLSIQKGFLRPFDTLVLDNATIHCKGASRDLDEWLWEEHNILLLYLPTRSPELNPIELLWNVLIQRMKRLRRGLEGYNNLTIEIADAILSNISIEDVYKCYQACGYFN